MTVELDLFGHQRAFCRIQLSWKLRSSEFWAVLAPLQAAPRSVPVSCAGPSLSTHRQPVPPFTCTAPLCPSSLCGRLCCHQQWLWVCRFDLLLSCRECQLREETLLPSLSALNPLSSLSRCFSSCFRFFLDPGAHFPPSCLLAVFQCLHCSSKRHSFSASYCSATFLG